MDEKLTAMRTFCKGQDYVERYQAFLDKYPQRLRGFDTLRRIIPGILNEVSVPTNEFNVLSVGSGDGKVDFVILRIIKDILQKKIHCRVIEPNAQVLAQFKVSLLSYGGETIFDIHEPKGFQDYIAEPNVERGKFQLVHFIHSIYYVDMEQALTHCYDNELGENGVILCVLAANDVIFEAKQKLFGISQPNQSIEKIVQAKGWKYHLHQDEYLADVTEVFDDQSQSGNLLLDFLTQTIRFRQTADQRQVQEMLDLIRKTSIEKDGKILTSKTDYYTIIFK